MGRTGTAINLIMPKDIGALYLLRLTYKIKPFEKQLPTTGELKTRAEADQIQIIAEAFAARTIDPDDLAMARRLLTHDKAEVIIAGLLRDHLGEKSKAVEDAAEARRGRGPRPVVGRTGEPTAAAQQPAPQRERPPRREREERRSDDRRREDRPERHDRPERPALERPERQDRPERPALERPERQDRPERPALERPERQDRPERRRDERPDRGPRRRDDVRPAREPEPRRPHDEEDHEVDLPRYEVTPMTESEGVEAPAMAEAPIVAAAPPAPREAARMSHSAFVDWAPPAQDDDDVPILDAMGDSIVPPAAEEIPAEDQVELFVNVGRRDGARTEDFLRVLEAAEGLRREDIARIRVRDRHTFVVVRKAILDQALAALVGARIGSRTANAEIAKPKLP